jgi:hypothetical protein
VLCGCLPVWAKMSKRIFENSAFLKAMNHAKPIQRKLMVEFIQTDHLLALTEIVVNILRGRINIHNIHWERLRNYQPVFSQSTHQCSKEKNPHHFSLFTTYPSYIEWNVTLRKNWQTEYKLVKDFIWIIIRSYFESIICP